MYKSFPSQAVAVEILISAVQKLSVAQDVADVIQIVKKAARLLMNAEGVTIVLREGVNCHYVDEDAIQPLWKGSRFPMSTCISGWVMHKHQSVVVPDVLQDDRIPHDVYDNTFVVSMAMVPIRLLDPMGAIGAYWSEPYTPSEESVNWLQSLADSTALAMQHASLREHSRKILSKSEQLEWENTLLRKKTNPVGEPCITYCAATQRILVGNTWMSVQSFLEQFGNAPIVSSLSQEGQASQTEKLAGMTETQPIPRVEIQAHVS